MGSLILGDLMSICDLFVPSIGLRLAGRFTVSPRSCCKLLEDFRMQTVPMAASRPGKDDGRLASFLFHPSVTLHELGGFYSELGGSS